MLSCLKEIQASQWERSVLFKALSGKSSQNSFQSCHWISLKRYQPIASWKAMKAKALNMTSKPQDLALIPRVIRATKMSRVWQEMSKYWSYTLQQIRLLASYKNIPKQLLVENMKYHSLDQQVRHTTTGTHSCDLLQSCLKGSTAGSTSNYSALLLFGTNLMI